jgi:hypothetical protein
MSIPRGEGLDNLCELLVLGIGVSQRALGRLEPFHGVEHDLFEVGLPAVQRLHLGLQVFQLARRVDHAAVEPLAVTVDPGPNLFHVRLGLGLLASEVAVLRGQRGDRVLQIGVFGFEPVQLGVFGKPAPPVLVPGELGIYIR